VSEYAAIKEREGSGSTSVRLRPFRPSEAGRPELWAPGVVLFDSGPVEVETSPPLLSFKCVFEGAEYYSRSSTMELRSGDIGIVGRSRCLTGGIMPGRRARGFSVFFKDDDLPGGTQSIQAFDGMMHRADALKGPLRRPLGQLASLYARRGSEGRVLNACRTMARAEVRALTEVRSVLGAYLADIVGASDRLSLARPGVRQSHAARLLAARAQLGEVGPEIQRVERVAARFGYPQPQFSRLFAEAFGQTPCEYRNACRLAEARKLLRESRLPLADIADAVGYPDYPSFSKAYRKAHGWAPREDRRRGS